MKKKISYKKKNKNSILGKKDKNKLKKIKEYLQKNKKQVGGNNENDNSGGVTNNSGGNGTNNSEGNGGNGGNNNNPINNQDAQAAEAAAADAKDAEQVAKRAQGLKEEWKEELSKPKIQLLSELALYAMYTVAGAFIYYPSFLVNFPNATLENIIPTEGGCKTLLGDELLCKRKIKCFLKKCSIIEDPDGERLFREDAKRTRKNNEMKKRMMKGGSKKNKTYKKNNYSYMKHIPKSVQRQIRNNLKKEIKQYIRLYKSVLRNKPQKGGSVAGLPKGAEGGLSKDMEGGLPKDMKGGLPKDMEGGLSKGMKGGLPEDMEGELPEGMEEMNKNKKMAEKAMKMGVKVANALKVDMGKENVDQITCANKGNNILCDPNKKIDYNSGKGSNFMSLFFGSTPEEYQIRAAEKIIKYLRTLLKATKRPDPQTGGGKKRKKRYKQKYFKQKGGAGENNTSVKVNSSVNNLLNYLTNKYENKPNDNQGNNLNNYIKNKYNSNGPKEQGGNQGNQANAGKLKNMLGSSLQLRLGESTPDTGSVDHELLEEFMREYFDADSIFKTLISYKMLERLFNIDEKEIKEYNTSNEIFGVDVTFPWTAKEPFMTPNDRRKCLLTHLTKTDLGDNYESNDLYEKCFICKNCTLANTSFQVWERLFSTLFQDGKSQLRKVANDLYQILKTSFRFKIPKVKQYYLLNLFAMNLIHSNLDINTLTVEYQGKAVKDLILGIPYIDKPDFEPDGPIREKLREIFVIMQVLDIETLLYKITYNMMYKKVFSAYDREERLHYIKKRILERFRLFVGKEKLFEITDNEINIDQLETYTLFGSSESLKIFEKNIEQQEKSKIDNLINDTLQNEPYTNLFNSLLNVETFDNPSIYTSNDVKSIIEKLNTIEFLEKDPANNN